MHTVRRIFQNLFKIMQIESFSDFAVLHPHPHPLICKPLNCLSAFYKKRVLNNWSEDHGNSLTQGMQFCCVQIPLAHGGAQAGLFTSSFDKGHFSSKIEFELAKPAYEGSPLGAQIMHKQLRLEVGLGMLSATPHGVEGLSSLVCGYCISSRVYGINFIANYI